MNTWIYIYIHICMYKHKLFEGVCFKLTSSCPPAQVTGVGSCGPCATLMGSAAAGAAAAAEPLEVNFFAQAADLRAVGSELEVQSRQTWTMSPLADPGDLHGHPSDPRAAQRDPKGRKSRPKERKRRLKDTERREQITKRYTKKQKQHIRKLPIHRHTAAAMF